MENVTLLVTSLFACRRQLDVEAIDDPITRETVVGCAVLELMQDMYHFSIAYNIRGAESNLTDAQRRAQLHPRLNSTVDIYVRPMALRDEILDIAYPIEAILLWRFGFIIRRADFGIFRSFYSEPFSRSVWNCIYACLLFSAVIFFILHRWDRRIFGVDDYDCNFVHELLVAAGAMCQHYLPVNPRLVSRRTAYFSFFLYTYIMYSFYTSNLLSHLVSDRDNELDLDGLADSSYKCVVLENMKTVVEETNPRSYQSLLRKKFNVIETTDINSGLEDLKSGSVALLSDYVTVYPIIKHTFEAEAICQLLEVDLYTNIKKYLFTSKGFPYKEEFKIGTLRLLETGILRRITRLNRPTPPVCITKPQIRTQFTHILVPLSILCATYFVALVILLIEKVFFERNRIFPYTH